MKLVAIKENKNNIYKVKPSSRNVIHASEGEINFPSVDCLSQLQIIFTKQGSFTLKSGGKLFRLGNIQSSTVGIKPGELGCETQPIFIFLPKDDCWMICTTGNMFFDE